MAEVMQSIDQLMKKQWEKIILEAEKYRGCYQVESCAALKCQAEGRLGRVACVAPNSD